MTSYKKNLRLLEDYKTVYKRKFKDEINNLIKLYEDRKVFNVKTVRNVLDKLTDKNNKKSVNLGFEEYNKLYEKYKDADPFSLKRKKNKAILRIQNTFRNSVIVEIVRHESALGNNVIEITAKPQRVGSIAAMDIKTILYKSYVRALRMLPKNSSFKFYSSVNFTTNDRERNSLVSNQYNSDKTGPWAAHVEAQIEKAVQSDEKIQLNNLLIKFHFIIMPAGGRGNATQDRDRESILNKKSVLRIKNDDNNCFWYALSALVHKNIKNIRDSRNTVARERFAKELCNKCKLPWDRKVDFLQIPLVEEALDCNIFIMDIDNIPILNSKINVWHALMYKAENRNKEQFWLLYGGNHYDAITNIKGFLAVDYFCCKCLQCFKHKETYDNHECGETKKKKKNNKQSVTDKDLAHYLKSGFCKGSKEELEHKITELKDHIAKSRKDFYNEDWMIKCLIDEHDTEQYIVYDFETDTHTLTHKPNHVEIDIIKIEPKSDDKTDRAKVASLPSHEYNDCLVKSLKFEGYSCEDKFCDWLFKPEHRGTTVFAHNGGGYDNKFVLQWCLSKGMKPDSYIRSGSHIMYMAFRKFKIRFVDTYYFFLEPLKALSKTYNIDTLKGHFPHHFNKPENQNYIGPLPSEDMFGACNMTPKEYKESFLPWYKTEKDKPNWNFKEELQRYCRADVELLSKAILKYRKMFKESLDVDPFKYVTLPSLCMSIYINKFLPDKTIVGNSADKIVSTVCKEWLIYLNDTNLTPETPILVEKKENIDYNRNKINKEKAHYSDKCLFTVDALDSKNKIVKEFYGCYWHGCPKCFPENSEKYDKTIERRNILEEAGYRVDEMWECEWCDIKKGLAERQAIEQLAKDQSIVIRDALFGGRTEAFKSYIKCEKHQKIFYYDVVSLYPTVNSLDQYAIGFKKYLNLTKYGLSPEAQINGFSSELLSGKFCGIAKVDIIPPKDLYIPVLPDNSNGKLLFHLNPLIGKTYASVELKRALEKGYKITKLYSALIQKIYWSNEGLCRELLKNEN